jgi:hypothetical protein
MSDRERWIVYPLLFLAIGMSLREKIPPTKRVVTKKFVVVDDNDLPVVEIGATDDGRGRIQMRQGALVVVNGHDVPVAEMSATAEGSGEIRLNRGDRGISLVLGHERNESGLYVDSPVIKGSSRQSVLGDLSKLSPSRTPEWLREILSIRVDGKK